MYLEVHVYFTLCRMLHVPNVRVIEKGQLEYVGHPTMWALDMF